MERPAGRTLELVIRTIPAYLLEFVTAIREKFVEQIVVSAGFGCHTCYCMSWRYLCLVAAVDRSLSPARRTTLPSTGTVSLTGVEEGCVTADFTTDAAAASRTVLPEWAWERHANPWSGWTRAATTPVLVYALYRRDWRLLAAAIGWLVVNPAAFPAPTDDEAWMTRGVLAEREWLRRGNGTFGTSWPNVLNLLNLPVTLYVGWATLRRRPLHAVVATALLMALKLLWIDELIARIEFGDVPDGRT